MKNKTHNKYLTTDVVVLKLVMLCDVEFIREQ